MLIVVISDNKVFRAERVAGSTERESEIVTLDDTVSSLADLEQYLYPSLFSVGATTVHARFMLEQSVSEMTTAFAKKLAASPTVFVFEEFAMPASAVTMLKRHGAVVHAQAPVKTARKGGDIFALASAVITTDKKDRWMNFQKALREQPAEALLGIMYWKVRDLMLKHPRTNGEYKALYENLLKAHAASWQTNTPLELMIEKVLLQ